jgi:hypothetical protein
MKTSGAGGMSGRHSWAAMTPTTVRTLGPVRICAPTAQPPGHTSRAKFSFTTATSEPPKSTASNQGTVLCLRSLRFEQIGWRKNIFLRPLEFDTPDLFHWR